MPRHNLEILKKLCRIRCSPEEEKAMDESLSRILDHVEQLSSIPTDNVEPCRFVHKDLMHHHFREDAVQEILSREEFLGAAPDAIGGMVRTPPVL